MGSRGSSSMTAESAPSVTLSRKPPSEEVQKAISQWTDDSTDMREESAAGATADSEVGKLDAWVSEGTYGGTMWRGMTLSNDYIDQLDVGAVIDQKGLSSWSALEVQAMSFAAESTGGFKSQNPGVANSDVVLRMEGSSHARSVMEYSSYRSEQEILLSSGTRQRVTGKHMDEDGRIYLDVEDIR